MDYSEKTRLPTPSELQHDLPANQSQRGFIAKSRETIKQILNGSDRRLLLIVGPCSIHDREAALEYAARLKELASSVSDTFFVVMRFYSEKSRTSLGWKGILYDPDLDGSHNIPQGLRLTRQLLLDLASMEIPAAAELLDPLTAPYYSGLLSWGCIGARTAESQPHRLMASGLQLPVGFKNNTSGNIDAAVNGALVASLPHTFIGINDSGNLGILQTQGNPYAHVTLRGGENGSNYDPESVQKALSALSNAQQPLRLVIDCSHDNSRRNHTRQTSVFESVLKQVAEGNSYIRGLILESHLFSGNQPLVPGALRYAISITDPCLDWVSTCKLIEEGRARLQEVPANACASGARR